jgi:hypothetical protein
MESGRLCARKYRMGQLVAVGNKCTRISGWRLAFDEGKGVGPHAEPFEICSGQIEINVVAVFTDVRNFEYGLGARLGDPAPLGHTQRLRCGDFLAGFSHDSASVVDDWVRDSASAIDKNTLARKRLVCSEASNNAPSSLQRVQDSRWRAMSRCALEVVLGVDQRVVITFAHNECFSYAKCLHQTQIKSIQR